MKRMWTDRQIRSMADESAKIRIEAGQTENAKPIYCHPINLGFKDASNEFNITCLIFNNDKDAMTFADFCKYVSELDLTTDSLGKVMASGYFVSGGTVFPTSYIYYNTGSSLSVIVNSPSEISSRGISFPKATFEAMTPSLFSDGVNKIN